MPTTNETVAFKITRPADRTSRKASATAALQQVHNQTAAAGGHGGTAASASNRDRRIASSTVP